MSAESKIRYPMYLPTPSGLKMVFWMNEADNSINMDLPALCEAAGLPPTEENKTMLVEHLKKAMATDPDFADIRNIPVIELTPLKKK